jgi:hypothetical protein
MTLRASLALAAAMVTASCAAPLLKLPSGAGVPAVDASDVLSQALTACQAIKTMTAEVAVSGGVGGRRTRARLAVGLAAPASAYIEAPAPFGAPGFVFAARAEDATLLLPRDRRVLEHGRPSDVLEAIAGVPLTPSDLRSALTGCAEDVDARSVRRLDDRWREVRGPSQVVYLYRDRDADPWRVVAVVHQDPQPEWRAEYREFINNIPRTIRLASSDPHRFDLHLTLSQVEINVALEPETFRVQIPAGTLPMTLQELRDAGPLADRSRKSSND